MKTYARPEISVEELFSANAVANDPFDYTGGSNGDELEVSATDWWDLLGTDE